MLSPIVFGMSCEHMWDWGYGRHNNLDALKAQSLHYHQQPADVIKTIKI